MVDIVLDYLFSKRIPGIKLDDVPFTSKRTPISSKAILASFIQQIVFGQPIKIMIKLMLTGIKPCGNTRTSGVV